MRSIYTLGTPVVASGYFAARASNHCADHRLIHPDPRNFSEQPGTCVKLLVGDHGVYSSPTAATDTKRRRSAAA
jgi:hypothetical protein